MDLVFRLKTEPFHFAGPRTNTAIALYGLRLNYDEDNFMAFLCSSSHISSILSVSTYVPNNPSLPNDVP
jgi:hypothetical protein